MAKRTTKKDSTTVVADLCLYGTIWTGAGWLARTTDGRMFGDGELRDGRTFTEACWMAAGAMESAGVRGMIRVFAPGGERMAVVPLHAVPCFGDMVWMPAVVYTIPMADVLAAATVPS